MDGVSVLTPDVGLARACRVMSIDRCAVYRALDAARRLIAPLRVLIARPAEASGVHQASASGGAAQRGLVL